VIRPDLFRRSGGFRSDARMGVAPSVEDVEFSHRLRRAGCRLAVNPCLQVQHVFGFSLGRSLANAARKARHWTRYSLGNGDLLGDSGAASRALKANVAAAVALAALLGGSAAAGTPWPLAAAVALLAADLWLNRGLIAAWTRAGGRGFALRATAYYLTAYAAAVALGAAAGAVQFWKSAAALGSEAPCKRSGMRPLSS
jgi:hypothetical protein